MDQHLYFVSGNAQAVTDGKVSREEPWSSAQVQYCPTENEYQPWRPRHYSCGDVAQRERSFGIIEHVLTHRSVHQHRTDATHCIHGKPMNLPRCHLLMKDLQVYAPAEHKANTVHDSLEQGEKLEDEGKDEAPAWAKK